MNDTEKQQLKQWVETWKRAGPMLERVRYEELAAYRHEGNEHVVEELLEMGYNSAQPRRTSGLEEQQRLFRKLRQ
jgi:hypothetical protein